MMMLLWAEEDHVVVRIFCESDVDDDDDDDLLLLMADKLMKMMMLQ